jgi:hypothetical protein
VYTETQTTTTNLNGLVSIQIGSGTSSDNFRTIDWNAGFYFIKTATDPSGGCSYTITAASQIMSVPYATYAKNSESSQANATNISKNTADIATNVTAINANTDKVGYTEALVSANTDVAANTLKVDTNATTVNASGALMDSEVTDLAGIKALDDNSRGLVYAIKDQGAYISWNNGSNTITGATGTAFVTVSANTIAIIETKVV